MTSKIEQLQRDILHVFRCARRQHRPDIAEYMLRALEMLDCETQSPQSRRFVVEAYREIANDSRWQRV